MIIRVIATPFRSAPIVAGTLTARQLSVPCLVGFILDAAGRDNTPGSALSGCLDRSLLADDEDGEGAGDGAAAAAGIARVALGRRGLLRGDQIDSAGLEVQRR